MNEQEEALKEEVFAVWFLNQEKFIPDGSSLV